MIEAMRSDQPIPDARLEALRAFTTVAIEKRGRLSEADIWTFQTADFSNARQGLEVVLGIALRTLIT